VVAPCSEQVACWHVRVYCGRTGAYCVPRLSVYVLRVIAAQGVSAARAAVHPAWQHCSAAVVQRELEDAGVEVL
jgi:hypothetical protein